MHHSTTSSPPCTVRAPVAPHQRERGVRAVVALTAVMMVVEISVGYATGSMALLADGWHMATHVAALGLAALAYVVSRRFAQHRAFAFGTGKIHALAGYTSAVTLGLVAVMMVGEGVSRLLSPAPIDFASSLPVAVLGLVVNLASVKLLHGAGGHHDHDHEAHDHEAHDHEHGAHDHDHDHEAHDHEAHDHDHEAHDHEAHDHDHEAHDHDHEAHDHEAHEVADAGPEGLAHAHGAEAHAQEPGAKAPEHGHGAEHDHNHRAALLHVVADALTSVLAIVALLGGRFAGYTWLDPAMGIVGGLVIIEWSVRLCKHAAFDLLDVDPSPRLEDEIRSTLEGIDDVRVSDLHVWSLGRGARGCIITVTSSTPRDSAHYRERLERFGLAHLTVEVRRCAQGHGPERAGLGGLEARA